MWRAALRLIRADLSARPAQALLTGLVVLIAAGTLVVTFHLRGAFDDPWENLVRATNAPDAVVDGSPETLARIAALPAVAQADPIRPMVDVPAQVGGMPSRLTVTGLPRGAALDRPLITRGRLPERRGEVLLDDVSPARPGDAVTIGGQTLRVVGLATLGRFTGGAWATAEQVRALAPARGITRASLPLRLHDPAAPLQVASGQELRVGRASAWREDFTSSAERRLTLMTATTLFALLGTAFTLATAIGGRVIAQRRQVALLRAVGLTPLQATALLVGFYAALTAVAAPPGLLLGALLAPALLDDTTVLGTTAGAPGGTSVLAALTTTLLVVVAATAVPAWRAGRRSPVDGLALGRDVTTARASRLAAVARRLRLPVVVGLGIKDAFAQRARSLLTLGSLVLAAMIVVCALAFEATMERLLADPALRAQPWDVRITPYGVEREAGARLAEAVAAEVPGAQVARMDEIQLTAAAGLEIRARVVDGPLGAFRYAVPDGRGIDGAGEITAGRGLLEALGARIGDTVELSARGAAFPVRIVGRHVEPDADGRALVIALPTLPPRVRALVDDPDWVLALPPGADAVAAQAAIVRAGDGHLHAVRPEEAMAREAGELRPIVYGVTGLLLAIGLVNLLTTLLLGLRERARDVAILGTVGATPRQVAGSVLAGGAALAIPAALIGLPAGAWVFEFLIARTDAPDGPDVATLPPLPLLALVLPVALALAVGVSALAARQARAIDPVRALRAE
jgi:putative ABC transport system permease protein